MKSCPEAGLYWCGRCKTLLPQDSFYVSKSRSTGVNSACKPCSILSAREWNARNKERFAQNLIKHKNSEKAKETGRAWRSNNRKHLTEYMREWRKANPEKVKADAAKNRKKNFQKILVRNREREILERRALPPWANRDEIMQIYLTAKKLTEESSIKYHVDHIVPLRGKNICGLHVENNLQILPARENLKKYNRFEETPL